MADPRSITSPEEDAELHAEYAVSTKRGVPHEAQNKPEDAHVVPCVQNLHGCLGIAGGNRLDQRLVGCVRGRTGGGVELTPRACDRHWSPPLFSVPP